ncbi:MAG: hypothetical protein M3425_12440 [Actinomycetota bacterium]|nr:hypothetical protein [Euzebyales bacterium]MDQ3344242.1 hypothetical protein [Actinomycetota bacterium]MDQ3530728.1 hypothetical protein [Actinomycetota bacterium]
MPTTRPRYQITETPAVAHALAVASRRWPGEPRSRLMLRLLEAGRAALERDENTTIHDRQAAVAATSGKYSDAFSADYLGELRHDCPK